MNFQRGLAASLCRVLGEPGYYIFGRRLCHVLDFPILQWIWEVLGTGIKWNEQGTEQAGPGSSGSRFQGFFCACSSARLPSAFIQEGEGRDSLFSCNSWECLTTERCSPGSSRASIKALPRWHYRLMPCSWNDVWAVLRLWLLQALFPQWWMSNSKALLSLSINNSSYEIFLFLFLFFFLEEPVSADCNFWLEAQ